MKSGDAQGDALTEGLACAVDEIKADEQEWVSQMMTMEQSYEIDKIFVVRKARAEGLAEGEAKDKAEGKAEMLKTLEQFVSDGLVSPDVIDMLEKN